jgi:anti-sigma regulatory factor (Ser/Thr protein kinase)
MQTLKFILITLSIDNDVLNAAKPAALRQRTTLSEVATNLVRAGLRAGAVTR